MKFQKGMLVLGTAAMLLAGCSSVSAQTVYIDGIERKYKATTVSASEDSARIYPWDEMSESERYSIVYFLDQSYSWLSQISEDKLGDDLGTGTAFGFDSSVDTEDSAEGEHTKQCVVRSVIGLSPDQVIAVELEDGWYSARKDEYDPPLTLGELLNRYNMAETFKVNSFEANNDPMSPYELDDDSEVWNILTACSQAPFVEDNSLIRDQLGSLKDTVLLSADCDNGVFGAWFMIYPTGYLETNAEMYGYYYEIGDEAAGKLIDYAEENGVRIPYEPSEKTVTGIMTSKDDSFIYVDDSSLCVNEQDGITFKIARNIYVDRVIKDIPDGQTITVWYDGQVEQNQDYLISSPYDAKVIWDDSDKVVSETDDSSQNIQSSESDLLEAGPDY